jgi:hypothetical protein
MGCERDCSVLVDAKLAGIIISRFYTDIILFYFNHVRMFPAFSFKFLKEKTFRNQTPYHMECTSSEKRMTVCICIRCGLLRRKRNLLTLANGKQICLNNILDNDGASSSP